MPLNLDQSRRIQAYINKCGNPRERQEDFDMLQILVRPGRYFGTFGDRSPRWSIAYLGYFMSGSVTVLGNLISTDIPLSLLALILLSTFGAALNAVFNLFLFGIVWMYLGSRMVGRNVSLVQTVQAVGYAFLWPGMIGSLFILFLFLFYRFRSADVLCSSRVWDLTLPMMMLVLGIATLVYTVLAVRHLNKLDGWRTFALAVWFPAFLAAVVGGLELLE